MALPKLAHVQMTSIGAVNQSIPNQGMEECSIDTHVTSSISVAFVHDAYNGLRIKEISKVKPWPNGPTSSRKWTQVELA